MPSFFNLPFRIHKKILDLLTPVDIAKSAPILHGRPSLLALAHGTFEEKQQGKIVPENFTCVSTCDQPRLLDAIYSFTAPSSKYPFRITKISGGLSPWAMVFKLEVNDQCFAIRLLQPAEYLSPEIAKKEAAREMLINYTVGSGDYAPYVQYVNFDTKIIIADYIPDLPDWKTSIDDFKLHLLADLLKSIKKESAVYLTPANVGAKFDYLLANFQKKADEINSKFCRELLTRYLDLSQELQRSSTALTLTHHDFNPWNILFTGEKVFVVDWEFSQLGNIFYDAATVAFFLKLTPPQEHRLLSYFLSDDLPLTTAILCDYYRYKELACLTYCICTFGLHKGVVKPLTPREIETLPAYSQVTGEVGDKEDPNGRLRNGVTFFRESERARKFYETLSTQVIPPPSPASSPQKRADSITA